jgi:thiamine-monophosphate kinase
MSASGEDSLIARYFRPIASDRGAFALLDDAATIAADGSDLVVTVDAIVSGVHFLPNDPPDSIARKALRVNLSDLAAKGAAPAGFVLTLALPEADDAFLAPFARALGEDAATFRCPLLGGDTVKTPGPLTISVTAFGRVPAGTMVPRTAARAGDAVLVTGTIGDAALGLKLLQQGSARPALRDVGTVAALISRYRVPEPRLALGPALRSHANAAMDVSDGLVGDLAKLCAASNVTAVIEAARVPLSEGVSRAIGDGRFDLASAITGGDDYEILCTVPRDRLESFRAAASAAGVPAAVIGLVEQGTTPPRFLDANGAEMSFSRGSYSHF